MRATLALFIVAATLLFASFVSQKRRVDAEDRPMATTTGSAQNDATIASALTADFIRDEFICLPLSEYEKLRDAPDAMMTMLARSMESDMLLGIEIDRTHRMLMEFLAASGDARATALLAYEPTSYHNGGVPITDVAWIIER